MKKWFAAILTLALMTMLPWAAYAEYSPGTLHEPPQEVLEHIAGRWPSYELEDYCEVRGTPKGDFSFALVKSGRERILVGYHEKGGRMEYWLKNAGAVPQGEEEAWFSVAQAGKAYMDSRTDKEEISDGLSFSVTRLDDAGETYEKSVAYHWEDGGFRLSSYKHTTSIGVFVEDGYLEFWDWGWWRKDGTVRGTVQSDLRYVSYNTLPADMAEAKKTVTTAPHFSAGNFSPQEIRFEGGQKYPVYLGPGKTYARSANGKGLVSTNDWIQVFGRYGDYILIQYDISAAQYRIGWIDAAALPGHASVPELAFECLDQRILADCVLTDDPVLSGKALCTLTEGTQVKSLADFGEYFYIEVDVGGKTVWGFVPSACLSHG